MAYGDRVLKRSQLAKKLTGTERAKNAGLKDGDLGVIVSAGEEARAADTEQSAQVADQKSTLVERADRTNEILTRGEELKIRVPAVIDTLLETGHTKEANFLIALAVARYRTRSLPPVDPEVAELPEVKSVKRVEREDRPAQLEGLAKLTKILLTRPLIVDELASRGRDRAALEQLHTDADAEFQLGRNRLRAAEATKREAAAVARQKTKWDANRAMIRAAVQGDDELEKLFAEC